MSLKAAQDKNSVLSGRTRGKCGMHPVVLFIEPPTVPRLQRCSGDGERLRMAGRPACRSLQGRGRTRWL